MAYLFKTISNEWRLQIEIQHSPCSSITNSAHGCGSKILVVTMIGIL